MWLLFGVLVCNGEVQTSSFQDRAAWVIDGSRLRVTVLQGGGHVGEIVLSNAGTPNPLWVPSRRTIDPDRYVSSTHERLYGGGPAARLASGLMGHNVCFPFWGNPTAAEYAAGMTYHGETGIARWTEVKSTSDSLTITAALPESRTRFTRTVRIAGQVAWFDEVAENESAWDRPVGWCEHVTLGAPFLEREVTVIEASLTRGEAYGHELNWPVGSDQHGAIDLRHVRKQATRLVNSFLVDPSREWGFFTAFHPRYRLLFGYAFRRADFPWLNVWEANNEEMVVRGMEFSNTPIHGTTKALVERPKLFGLPTFEWLDAKSRLAKRFCAFAILVPDGFRGVANVIVRGDEVTIVERETGRTLVVQSVIPPAARGLREGLLPPKLVSRSRRPADPTRMDPPVAGPMGVDR